MLILRLGRALLCAFAFSLSTQSIVSAQTAYPMLMSISPTAAARGTSSLHTIKSRYSMKGAYQILVSGEGVDAEVVNEDTDPKADPKAKANNELLSVRFHIAPTAPAGIRDVRVATPRGVSTVGQLVVVDAPVSNESADNDEVTKAQKVALPATLCGRIEKAEDVDFFAFQASQGEEYVFHVQCMRLQDRIHDLQQHADPILILRDAHGSVLAASDNECKGDPTFVHQFSQDGTYSLEIRDVRFQGNAFWEYSIEVSKPPLVVTTFPLGIAQQTATKVTPIGYGLKGISEVEVVAGALSSDSMQTLRCSIKEGDAREQAFAVTDLPLIAESSADNNTLPNAMACSFPSGINGKVELEGDVDYYSFDAKKGEKFSFELIARRLGSSLDSHLRLLDAKGNSLLVNDDLKIGKRTYSDSWIENWTVPADGKFYLEVRDLHLRGGESFVYFLKATRSDPYFLLFADTDKTLVGPGTCGVLFVRAEKKNGFDEPIQLEVSGLPPGVTAHCGTILPGKGLDGCIVFEVAHDASPSVHSIRIRGTSQRKEGTSLVGLTAGYSTTALVYQEIYQPGGGRGHWPVETHVVAVTEPGDIRSVALNQYDIHLKPGGSAVVEVDLERAPGFDKNVLLEATYSHLNTIFGSSLPEGITVDAKESVTLLTGGSTKGKLVFKAAPNAAKVEKQQIALMANVSLNFVMKATYASRPLFFSIDP